jgi:hypothetical protein
MLKDLDAVIASTSPPVGPVAGVALSRLGRAPLKYWPMDVNPDDDSWPLKHQVCSVPAYPR